METLKKLVSYGTVVLVATMSCPRTKGFCWCKTERIVKQFIKSFFQSAESNIKAIAMSIGEFLYSPGLNDDKSDFSNPVSQDKFCEDTSPFFGKLVISGSDIIKCVGEYYDEGDDF